MSKLPPHTNIALPALSPTMEMGTIVSWKKKEGDQLSEGDLLCEIETDKATMGLEASEEGYLAKIVVPDGSKDVPIGRLLCIVVEHKDDVAAFANFVDQEAGAPAKKEVPESEAASAPLPPSVSAVSPPSAAQPATEAATPSAGIPPGRISVSPFARKIAAEKKLDLATIKGTGPGGRILAEDVEAAAAAAAKPTVEAFATVPVPSTPNFVDIPLSNMRRTIAKRLLLSKQTIPHYYVSVDVKMDEILKLRENLNNMLKKNNKKLSVNDFIIKAAALSCMRVPEVNSFWMDAFIRQNNVVDMSVAVTTDAGLIAPIVFGANLKGLLEISDEVKALVEKARAGTLQPNEYQVCYAVHTFKLTISM
ncbi:unnamed protein product [Soboliphyme baturini]|uniref:Dihydrolipoamide acetyltransferase component of pyruvate dehydrogenase complex n=1 Tax=Soboliphyme baturini TaxID=241478 RepID=A0A183ICM1_9BILA|nr:unnamed protein product [Soboliphyme baturini]